MRALMIGWHNQMNTGDDAMLAVLSHALRAHMGISEVAVFTTPGCLAEAPGAAVDVRPLLGPFLGWLMRSGWLSTSRLSSLACRDASGYDVVILGGGSIFHSCDSIAWKQELVERLRRLQGGRLKVGAIGVSFGPFKDAAAEALARRFVRQLDVVVVRDQTSFEFARSCAAQGRVWVCPDISFMLKHFLRIPMLDGKPRVGICVKRVSAGDVGDRHLRETIGRAVRHLVAERGYAGATVFEFCGSRFCGDQAASRNIMRELEGNVDVRYRPYGRNALEMLDDVAQCGIMIGMRLHALLFAFIAGIPYVGISDQLKHVRVFAAAGAHRSMMHPAGLQCSDLLESAHMAEKERPALLGQVEENKQRVLRTLEEAFASLKAV